MRYLIPFLLFQLSILTAQDDYVIHYGYKPYTALADFTSCYDSNTPTLTLMGCGETFDLGFLFPFFEDSFDKISYIPNSAGGVPNSQDFNFFLFDGEYDDPGFGTLNHQADFRHYIDINDDNSSLTIEWVNVALFDEILVNEAATNSFNFQVKFYENGIIELHFGDMILENPDRFDPVNGFIDAYGEYFGPSIEIVSTDGSENYYITGTEEEPELKYSTDLDFQTFGSIPTKNWYVQFVPKDLVSTTDIKGLGNIVVTPNPTMDYVVFENLDVNIETTCRIFSIDGALVMSKFLKDSNVNLSSLNSGIYIIELLNREGVFKTKVIKQ